MKPVMKTSTPSTTAYSLMICPSLFFALITGSPP